MLKKILSLFCLVILSNTLSAQVNHWESLVLQGDTWRYLVPASQPSSDWPTTSFNDGAWPMGSSGIGFGDGDDATTLASGTLTVYMRKEFQILNTEEIDGLILDMDFDDGFVAYINGVEVARAFVSGEVPAFNQPSDGLHEALLYQGFDPERYVVDQGVLVAGTNILAVEVHNESTTSSDFSAIPFLSVGLTTSDRLYRDTPDWFDVPVSIEFSSSNLPIIFIETNGQEIPSEPKIDASMQVVYRGEGQRNFVSDRTNSAFLNYNGDIRIEVRGSSSALLDKKQFSLTTYANAEESNVNLLGMPAEHDWILNGLAYDPSLIRDYISYNLARKMGQYASRTQYVEVVLNGQYHGLYVLQEKLKADDNRIDINKIGVEDNELPKLTGGYVTKADKLENEVLAWRMPNHNGWGTDFIHEVPKSEEATLAQTNYIRGEFERLALVASAGNMSVITGIPAIIDMPSFIDYLLLCELASNADSYQFSTFFHKDRNGKLRAGPVWDFNLTYSNDLFFWGYDRSKTDVWQYDYENTGPTFWKDLATTSEFRCYMAKRWNELRQPGQPFHLETLSAYIDEVVALLSEAVVREHERWGTVENHAAEIQGIKAFLDARIRWMTTQLGSFGSCASVSVPTIAITKIHYRPQSVGDYSSSDMEFIELTNIGDQEADLTGVYIGGTGLVYQFPSSTIVPAGGRVILANESDAFQAVFGFAPFDEFSRSLNNEGQTIQLLDAFGNEIDEVTYSPNGDWPASANGQGDYLEVVDVLADNADPENWRASSASLVAGVDQMAPVFTLAPNPTSGILSISSQSLLNTLMVFDIRGDLILEVAPNALKYDLNLDSFETGVYFLQVQTSTEVFTRKVKKQ